MDDPKVAIIILNWNGWEETLLQAKAFTKLLKKVLSKMLRSKLLKKVLSKMLRGKMLRNDRVLGSVVEG